jgi:hypothetical protein
MIRPLAVLCLLALSGCERPPWVDQYCKLYPSKCASIQPPPERPAIAQPAPPVASPKVVKPRLKPKPSPAVRRAPKAPRVEGGPDLPYPCWLVRMHATGKSPAQMDAMAQKHGVKLSPKQERQARACLR